jgi:hypothetical protein
MMIKDVILTGIVANDKNRHLSSTRDFYAGFCIGVSEKIPFAAIRE